MVKQKSPTSKASVQSPKSPRRLKAPARFWYRPWTWSRHLPPPPYKPLPKARQLFASTIRLLLRNWKLFGGIALIYAVLNVLLVRGLSGNSDLGSIKSALDSWAGGSGGGRISSALASFGYLFTGSGTSSTESSSTYQNILLLVTSLAFIWALRQTVAKNAVRIRDSFYKGMYPLVTFVLVLLAIGLQLLPLVIGGGLYNLVVSNGIAVHFYEQLGFGLLFFVLGIWSLRMVTHSLIALYIVTLPNMTPLKALRSAKELIYGRRLIIWRKLIFLPIILLVLALIIEIPLILFATSVAQWVFFALGTIALAVVHGYMYNLYRSLLDE